MHSSPTSLASTTSIRTLQVLNCVGFILMLTLNFLAVFLPLNGKTTGELSDQYPNLFVPSGLTFSIWGIIYLLLLLFTFYQASTLFSSKASQVNAIVRRTGIWYILSSLSNATWILVWHYEWVLVSVVVMAMLLFTLIRVNLGLSKGLVQLNGWQRFIIKAPFGVYLGWICVACIANVTSWLTGVGWEGGFGQDTWAVFMIVLGAIIVLFATSQLHNGYLALAVAWAFWGIVSKRLDQEPLYYSIVLTAGVAALVMLLYGVLLVVRDFKTESVQVAKSSTRAN